jgi:hypothetical protein
MSENPLLPPEEIDNDPLRLIPDPGSPVDDGPERDRAILDAAVVMLPEATEAGADIGQVFDSLDMQRDPNTGNLLSKEALSHIVLQANKVQTAEAIGTLTEEIKTQEDYDLITKAAPEMLMREPRDIKDLVIEHNAGTVTTPEGEEVGFTAEDIARIQAEYKIYRDMNAAMEERGITDLVDDFIDYFKLGAIVTGDPENFFQQSIENRLYKTLTGQEPPEVVGEHLYELAEHFKYGMDAENREIMGDILWESAMEATDGNVTRAADVVTLFLDDFSPDVMASWKALEAVDATGLASFMGKVVKLGATAGRTTMPGLLKALGSDNAALAVTKSAVNNERVAKAANLDQEAIVDSVHPVAQVSTNPRAVDLAGEAGVETFMENNNALERIVKEADDLLAVTHMDTARQNAFRAAWTDNKQRYIQRLNAEKDAIKDAHILSTDENTFKMYVEFADGRRGVEEISYAMDELGTFNVVGIGAVEAKTASAHHLLNRLADNIVPESIVIREQAGRLRTKIIQEVNDVLTPLKKLKVNGHTGEDRVLQVLVAGDKWGGDVNYQISPVQGKVFTETELENGIETAIGTVKLSPEEIKAYRDMREIIDAQMYLKERANLDTAIRRGDKEAVIAEITPDGKIASRAVHGSEVSSASLKEGQKAYGRSADGNVKVYSKSDLEDLPSSEAVLKVGSDNAVQVGDDFFEYVVVPRADLKMPTTRSVSQRQVGYFPRGQQNVLQYLRILTPARMNGVRASTIAEGVGPQVRAIASASDSRELRKSIQSGDVRQDMRNAGLTEEQIATGEGKFWAIDTDKLSSGGIELDIQTRNTNSTRNRYLLRDVTGDGAMPAQRALASAISNVSNQFARGAWFETKAQQWVNTARKAGVLEDPSKGFSSPIKQQVADYKGMSGTDIARGLKWQRDWLNQIAGIPTAGERAFQAQMLDMAKAMEGLPFFGKAAGIRKVIMKLGHTNPTDSMRAAAFHAFLGVLNPAQLLIQASQFTIALSLNPARAVDHLQKGMSIRLALNTYRSSKDLANSARVAGMKVDEFKAMIRAYDRSGIEQGVKQTGDYARLREGATLTQGMVHRIFDQGGLFFFKEGELFSRTYAFLNSADDFFKASGKKKWSELTDDDLFEVHAGMQSQMFMLDKNNRAFFQSNPVLSVPTQFWQIATKSLEKMGVFPGQAKANVKFSSAERMRIVAGQAVLFGSAGVPFADWFITNAGNMLGADPGKIPNETKALMGRGATGFLQQVIFGQEVDIADRTAVISSVEGLLENITSLTPLSDKPFSEVAFNAFGSVLGRASELMTIGKMYLAGPEEDLLSIEDSIQRDALYGEMILRHFAKIISSMNNLQKGMLIWKLGGIPGTRGQLLFDMNNEQYAAAVGQMLGFAPLEAKLGYEIQAANLRASKLRGEVASIVANTAREELRRTADGDMKNIEAFNDAVTILMTTLGASEAEKVLTNRALRAKFGEPAFNSVLRTAYKNVHNNIGQTRGLPDLLVNPTETSPYANTLITEE